MARGPAPPAITILVEPFSGQWLAPIYKRETFRTPGTPAHSLRLEASTLYARTDAPLFVYSRPGGPTRSNFLDASAGGAEAAICCCRLSSAPALQRHHAQQGGLSREQGA